MVIDKVLFDSHAILGSDDSHLAKSVASILSQSQTEGVKLSGPAVETALKEGLSSLTRNDIFAAKLNANKSQKEEYESN